MAAAALRAVYSCAVCAQPGAPLRGRRSIAPFAAASNDMTAVVPIAEQLCQALAGEPGEGRENANLGLRDLTESGLTDPATAQPVVDVLVPQLAARVKLADKHALTHLHTVLFKFGTLCSASHAGLQGDLFGLFVPGMDVTLAFLATRCCSALISAGTRSLVAEMLTAASNQLQAGSFIFGEVIAKLAEAAGRRMGPLVADLVPKLVGLLEAGEEEEGAEERQAGALAAVAAIISACPKQCKGADFTAQALEKASELLALTDDAGDLFDASSGDDDDEDGDDSDDDDDEDVYGDDGDETDDNEYDDEDDLTWKVRVAAAKCVAAVGMVPGTDASTAVVQMLIDRVENESSTAVKMEIYSACEALLCTSGSAENIAALADKIVSTDFTAKTTARASALAALNTLSVERNGCLAAAAGVLCPGLCLVLGSSKSELRGSAAGLLQTMIPSSPSETQRAAFAAQVGPLATALASCVQGSDARVQVAALNAVAALAGVSADESQAAALFDIASGGVGAANKECTAAAIRAASCIVALHGGSGTVATKVKPFLEQIQQCLDGDDTVRATAIDALSTIASDSGGSAVLSDTAGGFGAKLGTLLQATADQTQRRRLVSALAALAKVHSAGMDAAALLAVVSSLVGPADIQLSAKVLELCGSLLSTTPAIGSDLKSQVWPATFAILNNPSLNESAKGCVVEFCVAVVKAETPGFGFDFVLEACLSAAVGKTVSSVTSDTEIARHALKSLGACVGAMAAAAPSEASTAAAARFVGGLSNGKQVNADQTWSCEDTAVGGVVLALRSLGDLGASVDLSQTTHFQTVLECLEKQTSAEIRNAATDCVTRLCQGNVTAFTPLVVSALKGGAGASHGLQARVLQAVRELAVQVGGKLDRSVFVPVLLEAAASASSEVRLGVGQCLGNMMTDAGAIADFEERARTSTDGAVTQTIVTAMQSAVRAGVAFDIEPFVALIDSDDLGVKEACLSLLNDAVRYNPEAALPVINDDLLQKVYTCARFYSNLVQVVELGQMKHLVDRGLALRRAAFEVVEALIFDGGSITELVEKDLDNFITTVAQGLGPCAVTTVTMQYKVGPGNTDNVIITPPNMKTKSPGGPAPGHAAFCEARVAEIAAIAKVDPSEIEVEDTKTSAQSELKALGVVDFSFIVRVADPAAAIGELKKAVDGGAAGTAVPVEPPVKELDRELDVSSIQEVALVTVSALCDPPCAVAPISLPPRVSFCLRLTRSFACGHSVGRASSRAPGGGSLAARADAGGPCEDTAR